MLASFEADDFEGSTAAALCEDGLMTFQGDEGGNELSVQLVGPNGESLGVVAVVAALDVAKRLDLDLIPMDKTTAPPTSRILDYGKWKYEENKRRSPEE